MFKQLISTAIISTVLASGMILPASAMGGGDGEYAESTYGNTTIRSQTVKGGRLITTRKGNKVTKKFIPRKPRKVRKVRRARPRSRPYAINHTDGIASIGIRPGLRLVISPFGISISN